MPNRAGLHTPRQPLPSAPTSRRGATTYHAAIPTGSVFRMNIISLIIETGFPKNFIMLSFKAYFRRPVRMCLPIEDNMTIIGRRNPYRVEYKVCTACGIYVTSILLHCIL